MAYFRDCPLCGAHLDPGERCDCAKEKPLETSGRRETQAVRAGAAVGAVMIPIAYRERS